MRLKARFCDEILIFSGKNYVFHQNFIIFANKFSKNTMTNIYKNREIPKFLLDKRYLIGSVIFILVFSFFFMTIYTPFSNTNWIGVKDWSHLGMSVVFYIGALLILFVSKYIMLLTQRRTNIYLWVYALWFFSEILLLSIFYTFFTVAIVGKSDLSIYTIFYKGFGCMLLIIAIPYTIMTLYAAYKAKTEELQLLQYELSLATNNTVAYPSLINLHDYNGALKLTISADSLYYMESQDNYVKIYYENQGKMLSYMLRCRTKAVEENLSETNMVRCHRSFMVNIIKINHIKKVGKARYVVLNNTEIKPIPVSKSYFKNLVERIDKYNASAVTAENAAAASNTPIIPTEEVIESPQEGSAE